MQGRRFDPGFALLVALVAAAGTFGCAREPEVASEFELRRTLESAARCHVSVPDAATAEVVREAIQRRSSPRLEYAVTIGASRVEMLGDDPRIWIGNAAAPGAEAALARLGITGDSSGFRFEGREFHGRSDGVVAT
jgi:hypothetical protein